MFEIIELLDDNLQLVVGELLGSLDLEVDNGKFLSGKLLNKIDLILINGLNFEPWGWSLPAEKSQSPDVRRARL